MAVQSAPTTKAELDTRLDELILRALENGVDVNDSAYDLRHDDPELPNWEVQIVETAN